MKTSPAIRVGVSRWAYGGVMIGPPARGVRMQIRDRYLRSKKRASRARRADALATGRKPRRRAACRANIVLSSTI